MPYLGKPPPLTASVLEDADQDTKIQVEESADEDTIRFDIAGAEVATLTDSSLVLKGTTPTLTIGDAGTEDAKIVFDGNAQDFHIGLDDTADDLVIGKGSALGTTTHMAFTEDGEVTKPLQPAFNVIPASAQTDMAAGSHVTVVWGTENFDVGANFASNTFTAPVTGKYLLTVTMRIENLDSAASYYQLILWTSNRLYNTIMDPDFGQDAAYWNWDITACADMDASDTAYVTLRNHDGTAQTDVATTSCFSGCLLG